MRFPQVYACNLNQLTRSGLKSIGSEDPEELVIVNKYKFGADMNIIDNLKIAKIVKRATTSSKVQVLDQIQKCEDFIDKLGECKFCCVL